MRSVCYPMRIDADVLAGASEDAGNYLTKKKTCSGVKAGHRVTRLLGMARYGMNKEEGHFSDLVVHALQLQFRLLLFESLRIVGRIVNVF